MLGRVDVSETKLFNEAISLDEPKQGAPGSGRGFTAGSMIRIVTEIWSSSVTRHILSDPVKEVGLATKLPGLDPTIVSPESPVHRSQRHGAVIRDSCCPSVQSVYWRLAHSDGSWRR